MFFKSVETHGRGDEVARPRKETRAARGARAVIYLRVSTEEQTNPGHFGIAAQDESCRAYADRKTYLLVAVHQDLGLSGAKSIEKRPGLRAALRDCEEGRADVVVCYAQDRLARKASVFDEIRERAIRHRYRLEVVREGQDLTADENEISGDVMAFVAGLERKLIARRLYGGRRQRSRRDGRGSAPLPYGYRRGVDNGVEINEPAAVVVRLLIGLRDAGMTYQATANRLNAAGYLTPRGGSRWTPGHVQGIERNATLYRTGQRTWGGIDAEQRWPQLVEVNHAAANQAGTDRHGE